MEATEIRVFWQGELLAWEHLTGHERPSGTLDGAEAAVAEARDQAPLDGTWAETALGDVVVRARRTRAAVYQDPGPPLDRVLAGSMTAAMGLGVAFFLFIGLVPPAGRAITIEALRADDALLAYVAAPHADEPVPRIISRRDGSGPIAEGLGRPMELAAGVSGAEEGPRSRRGQIRFLGERELTRRIPRAAPDARRVGILGVLAAFDAASRDGALAGIDDVEGWSRDEAYGRPLAVLVGQGHGTDGFDMVGTGRGGCWPGDEDCALGTVGSGPGLGFGGTGWGTTCGEHTCEAAGFGGGRSGGIIRLEGREEARRRPRRPSSVPAAIRHVRVRSEEGLTREQIRRALRPHRDALRHCYGGAYAAASGQTGEVEVGVVIAPDGRVLTADVVADTVGDAEVARCIAGAVRRVDFPAAAAPTAATVPFALDVFGG